MKTLTVITTTYNRAYCLHQVYESLIKQDCDDFIWLVMDDGSTDNTKGLVDAWINENKIEIEYYYKPNGGMHTARNAAYEKVHTELNVIIDSDDWMAEGAVRDIVRFWQKNKREDIAGFFSLNADPKGNIIGSQIPDGLVECHYTEFWGKYKMYGDKKLVYRSELTRLYPYPEFPGEKFYPASYKFYLLDRDYKMLVMNSVTCIVDYNEDSMTYNKIAQYRSCCKGFAHYRNEMIRISKNSQFIVKNMIHYVAESKMAKNPHFIRRSSNPAYAVLCWPAGLLYYLYITHTRKKY